MTTITSAPYYFSGAAGGVVPDEVSVPDDDQEPLRRHVSVPVSSSSCPRDLVTSCCHHDPWCRDVLAEAAEERSASCVNIHHQPEGRAGAGGRLAGRRRQTVNIGISYHKLVS